MVMPYRKCGRRKLYILALAVFWLSTLVFLKIITFAPRDATQHIPPIRLSRNTVVEAAEKVATPTHVELQPIKIDSETAHAQEKLKSKRLVSEKSEKMEVQSREKMNQSDAIYRTNDTITRRPIKPASKTRLPKWKRRFPHIILLGMGKAGTRAVYDMIRMHPDVKGPEKEIRFFDRHFDLGIHWYMYNMPQTHSWEKTIEKSPSYIISLVTPPRLLDAMKKFSRTHVQFIVVFRDPFTRAVSEYLEWKIQRQLVKVPLPPFHEIALDKRGQVDINCPPINTSAYSYHLENWLKYFSRDDFCFVSGDSIIADPYPEMKQLERCLGLKSYLSPDNFVFNPSRGFYCLKKAEVMQCMSKSKGRIHPSIEKSVEEKLRAFYAPFNKKLYELTGRDFGWT
jgi:hypothetical protein